MSRVTKLPTPTAKNTLDVALVQNWSCCMSSDASLPKTSCRTTCWTGLLPKGVEDMSLLLCRTPPAMCVALRLPYLPAGAPLITTTLYAVSYTHLRAHETEADL
eukprot:3327940-Amphidinium_carterae.1